MSVLRSSDATTLISKGKAINARPRGDSWVRPSDWLPITPPGPTEQKFVGLVAVFNQSSNYFALQASTSTGTYLVDWGDGTSETYGSGTTAYKNYVYSDLSSTTESFRGYRQAIITVTPVTTGATFSSFRLDMRHTAKSVDGTPCNWLEVAISVPNATTLRIGGASTSSATVVQMSLLESVTVVSHNTTTMAWMFNNCNSLQNVRIFNTAIVTNMSGMFGRCGELKVAPYLNTSAVTDMTSMFTICVSLKSVPLYDTANVTLMQSMFSECYALTDIPAFNTVKVTNMLSMFNLCKSITSIPSLNMSAVTTVSGMFSNCTSLAYLPALDTSKCTVVSNMFNGCLSLTQLPELDLGAVTTNTGNALSLSTATSNAKLTKMRWSQTFSNANLGTTELNEMYTALSTLSSNITNVTASGGVATYTVSDISAFAATRTVTITGVNPTAYNLVNATIASVNTVAKTFAITNAGAIGTYVSGGVATIQDNKTITVTGNPGIATDDPTIATAKGWVVTG